MAEISPPPNALATPPGMLAYVEESASRDADRVIDYLRRKGLVFAPNNRATLPAHFLLGLAIALRLRSWEVQGFSFHRQTGLPAAHEALVNAFLTLEEANGNVDGLYYQVEYLATQRLAWHAYKELGADILLDDLDAESAQDALAEYLWSVAKRGHEGKNTKEIKQQ